MYSVDIDINIQGIKKIMSAIIRALSCALTLSAESEGPLARMFRTEYGSEYSHLRKSGVTITECFVQQFLKDNKSR